VVPEVFEVQCFQKNQGQKAKKVLEERINKGPSVLDEKYGM